ncbi:DEAD/DEAH box helicase [Selenomonas sputigena]|uniref:DEAD/DEAH box helicase n=1 Tax=Selenomonas sputigena TaxID=69823 RepID=UPI00222FB345|nr:DEAD/DEAH box helicase [Selenomonas sputigena]UZD42783.1 DEAD/DEAH box helicase [Selenomonas sputigena]
MGRAFTPRPYQRYAIRRIIDTPAVALLLDMGMGKTVSTLTAINELMFDRFEVHKVLVIAPLRVALSTWRDECEMWEHTRHLRISVAVGDLRTREAALAEDADIYVVNRDVVKWLVGYYRAKWPFDMVVVDESSSFKNPASQRFRALRKVRPLVQRIVLLTGTPAPNGLMDLWSQFYLLDRGERLGRTLTEYRERYFRPGQQSGHIVYSYDARPGAEQEIFRRIGDICVSMKSEDYLTLPPLIQNVVRVQLPEAVARRYREMERELVLSIGDADITAVSAAALSNKLLQMANGAVYDTEGKVVKLHDAKAEALDEIISCNEGKSVMVIYSYRHDLDALRRRYPKARELKTADDIRAWNAGQISLLLVHPQSAGHGLNLQHGGHIVVWYGLTWSLEAYQQTNKRLHRPGQTEPVVLHHLVARDTVDEDVMRALAGKAAGQESMLEAVKARIERYKAH